MATKHPLYYLVSDATDNVDLVHRYCPGLESHTPLQIAQHIHADPTECWPWDAWHSTHGHGSIGTEPTPYGFHMTVPAHRYMYDTLVGAINIHNYVHHRCQNPPCWNPFHLQEVTPKEHRAIHYPR